MIVYMIPSEHFVTKLIPSEHFVTKLGVMMHHNEPECYMEKLIQYCQGHRADMIKI